MSLTQSSPRLAYELHGTDGTPVLMIMGFGMRGVVWRPQVEALSVHHKLVTYDHRGVGSSESAPGWWTMDTLCGDALRLVDELGWSRFHLVGSSMGGMVAQHLALAAQHRVTSLSLIVTQPGGRLAWLPSRRGIRAFLKVQRSRNKSRDDQTRAMSDLLYTDGFSDRVPSDRLSQRMDDTTGVPPARATLARQFHAIARHRTVHRLHEIHVPTLVVQAAQDRLIRPRHSETIAKSIPGARLVRMAEAGHGLVFEQADALNRELLRHFAEAEAE